MKERLDFELTEDINKDDLYKLIDNLECYVVKIPSQSDINNTIDNLRELVPRKKSRAKILGLLKTASREIGFMSSTYWLISFTLFIIGVYFVWMNGGSIINSKNPYISGVLLAPIPFILGIIEIFRGREEGVIELELSCKISIGEIMFSRLIIICIYNILLNTMLSIILVYFNSGILLLRITLMWLAPFTVISGIGLILVSKLRGSYVAAIFTGVWMVFIMVILNQKQIMDKLIGINITVYVVLTIVGIILMIMQIRSYSQRGSSFFQRSVLDEAKN
jgi:hypothetical protein